MVSFISSMYTSFINFSFIFVALTDMGLGKTFQVTCLLVGLIRSAQISKVLIVAPVSVMESWAREIHDHLVAYVPRVSVEIINGDMPKKRRITILNNTFLSRNPKVIITSYNLISGMTNDFTNFSSPWDYIILDEGHAIKNTQTKIFQAVHELKTENRLLLTGTPIQNHLTEFWSLVVRLSFHYF